MKKIEMLFAKNYFPFFGLKYNNHEEIYTLICLLFFLH